MKADFYRKTAFVFEKLKGMNFFFAGGCIRDLITGNETKDYDLYFNSKEDSFKALARFGSFECGEFVTTISEQGLELSFIHNRNFKTASEIINGFDFHCVSACIDQDRKVHKHYLFKDAATHKVLTVNKITTPFSTLERVVRFTKRGFYIGNNELMTIAEAIRNCDELSLSYYEANENNSFNFEEFEI